MSRPSHQLLHPSDFLSLLRRCTAISDHSTISALHAYYLKSPSLHSTFLSNHLLRLYAPFPTLALRLFRSLPSPNTFSSNALLLSLSRLPSPLPSLRFFHSIPSPDLVSFNTLLSALSNSFPAEAAKLFSQLRRTSLGFDSFTLSSVLSAVPTGSRGIHGLAVSSGLDVSVSVCNALVDAYSRTGRLADSRKVFDGMGSCRDVVSWNCMIMAYAKRKEGKEAVTVLREMREGGVEVGEFTVASVVAAFVGGDGGELSGGLQCHGWTVKAGFGGSDVVGGGLVDFYGKCGRISDAEKVFDEVVSPDVVVWNAMMNAYALKNSGLKHDVVDCFSDMHRCGVKVDDRSVTMAIGSADLQQGTQLHSLVSKLEVVGVSVWNALLVMYLKFGRLGEARQLFERMPCDVISFNSMIAGYARHGLGTEAIALFRLMVDSDTLRPTGITFASVLSVCAHTGQINNGWEYFGWMEKRYGIRPTEEHYTCMIDLLGRAGEFDQAEQLIKAMPFDPGTFGWTALLSACRTYGNFELGVRAAGRLVELEPSNAAGYVSLSNMYARMGKWDEVERVRKLMGDRKVKKCPGFSWTEGQPNSTSCLQSRQGENLLENIGTMR